MALDVLTACPGCGSPALDPAGGLAGSVGGRRGSPGRAVCRRCGRCWELRSGEEVDSVSCPGCASRTVCESRPTWLVAEMSRHFRLRDGTEVLVRPLLYSDRRELEAGFEQLSAESKHLRFGSAPAHLGERDLEYLTNLDYRHHFAWAAFVVHGPVEEGGGGREAGIGVARYVRSRRDPAVAEAAVTVADGYQRRGLGTVLLGVLAEVAAGNGIERFVGHVLWENDTLLDGLRQAGARIVPEEPGVARIEAGVELGRLALGARP
jgi:GNAT superfamily N-acetyltransferase